MNLADFINSNLPPAYAFTGQIATMYKCEICQCKMIVHQVTIENITLCHECFNGLSLFKFSPITLQNAVDVANRIFERKEI